MISKRVQNPNKTIAAERRITKIAPRFPKAKGCLSQNGSERTESLSEKVERRSFEAEMQTEDAESSCRERGLSGAFWGVAGEARAKPPLARVG